MARSSNSARSVLADVAVNVAFAVARALLLIGVVRYAGLTMTPAILGLFLLARRIWTTLANVVQGGVSQTLLRFISIHHNDKPAQRAYLLWIIVSTALYLTVVPGLAWMLRRPLATLMFAAPGEYSLAFWTAMAAVTTAVGFSQGAFLFAQRRIVTANCVQLFGVGGAAMIALAIAHHPSPAILTRDISLILAAVTLGALLFLSLDLRVWERPAPGALRSARQDFATYGTPRAFSAALETFGAMAAPWLLRRDPAEAAYFLIALTMLNAIQFTITPMTQILAAAGARSLSSGDGVLARTATILSSGALIVGPLASVIFIPWVPILLRLWVARESLAVGALFYAELLCVAITPMMMFYLLRNVIEMRWKFPCNLITQVTALLTFFAVYWVALETGRSSGQSVGMAFTALLFAQGAMSAFWVRKDFPSAQALSALPLVLLAGSLVAINAWAAGMAAPSAAAAALAASVVLVAIFFGFPRLRPAAADEVIAILRSRAKALRAPQAISE